MALSQHPEKMKKGVKIGILKIKLFGKKLVKKSHRVIYGFLFLVYCYPSASGCYLVQSLSI